MEENPVKRQLQAGGVVLGPMVLEFNTPGMASLMEATGVDFVLYDMEHGGFGFDTMRQVLSYSRGRRAVPILRVPDTQYGLLAPVMDMGAKGVVVPFVDTAEQARTIVAATKYPPWGRRGASFRIAHDDFRLGDVVDKMREANQETLVVVQIETGTALSHLDAIAAIDGVDVLVIGHLDLANSLGIPGRVDDPRILNASRQVIDACNRQGKACGRVVWNTASAIAAVDDGYRFLIFGSDVVWLQESLARGVSEVRARVAYKP